jgi:ribosomal protein S18 acetylase RimI-like enzyme
MTSRDLEALVKYQVEKRETEPDIFPDFDESQYRENFSSKPIEDYPSNKVILVIDGDKIVGRVDVIVEYSFMDFATIGYIDWIYVLKNYRKQGIAKKLIEKAEDFMRENQVDSYYLFPATNDEAQAFYNNIDIEIKNVEKAQKKLRS